MERLYTEPQWRAIARVEELSGQYSYHEESVLKRIYGGVFASGEFYLCYGLYGQSSGFVGPPDPYFFVKEGPSKVRFVNEALSRTEALEVARARITLIGPESLSELLAAGRRKVAEAEEAKRKQEAEAAAREEAKRLRREKTIKKRARAVFAASEGKCHYCATELDLLGKWHIEHKMPRALKGGSEQHNLVAACVPCNMRKRDKTDLEFQARIAAEQAIQTAQGGVEGADPVTSVEAVRHDAQSLSSAQI